MMLGDDAVSAMYRLLRKESKSIGINELGVFKYEIPKKSSLNEYVVINHLPFVQQDTINEGVVNVNVHVKRTASDEPNTRRLKTIAKNILVFLRRTHTSVVRILNFILIRDLHPTTITLITLI